MPPYNLFRAGFRADPYAVYAQLRDEAPVVFGTLGAWYVTRYAEAVSVLRDARFSPDRRYFQYDQRLHRSSSADGFALLDHTQRQWLIFMDPPDHTRLRAWVGRALSTPAVEALRPQIERLVDESLDRLAAAEAPDVMADVASRLPLEVIAAWLGFPPADREKYSRWAPLARAVDPIMAVAAGEAADGLMAELLDYLRHQIAQRRENPTDDLISQLIYLAGRGSAITDDELLGTCSLLFNVGHLTVRNLIGNGTLALLQNPDEFLRLRQQPHLAASAVEELLRFDSPVQVTSRFAREPVDLSGQRIESGQAVLVFLGSANRDPAQFAEPDRLNLSRPGNQHLTFGYSAHSCLGAGLARVQAQVWFSALARRLPHLRLAPDPLRWQPDLVFRELKALPVAL